MSLTIAGTAVLNRFEIMQKNDKETFLQSKKKKKKYSALIPSVREKLNLCEFMLGHNCQTRATIRSNLTITAGHLVRIVEVHDLSHMIIGRQKAFYVSMVGAHPEFLQQVDVVLLLLNKFPDGLHPQRLVLGPK